MEPHPITEITELHEFFEAWFNGKAAEAGFSRFEEVLAPDFELAATDGTVLDRDRILAAVRNRHGGDQRRIWIENATEAWQIGDVICTSYEEWQSPEEGQSRGRNSTALFMVDESAPNGVIWLRVHETWLPEKAGT